MDKATKASPYVRPGVGHSTEDNSAGVDAPKPLPPAPEIPQPSTDEVTRDRWFLEQRGNRRVPKRLNIVNEVLVSAQGPLQLRGNITLKDEDGQESFHNELRLCRCGASNNKPFCDEAHVELEFFDNGAINQVSTTLASQQPQTLLVTCVKDGPLKFSGYARLYNRRGQEYACRSSALCRCGRSSKKPFCDCC